MALVATVVDPQDLETNGPFDTVMDATLEEVLDSTHVSVNWGFVRVPWDDPMTESE